MQMKMENSLKEGFRPINKKKQIFNITDQFVIVKDTICHISVTKKCRNSDYSSPVSSSSNSTITRLNYNCLFFLKPYQPSNLYGELTLNLSISSAYLHSIIKSLPPIDYKKNTIVIRLHIFLSNILI